MTITPDFFKGLREYYESRVVDSNEITMLRCLRWAVKHGMIIEIKRASGTMMNLRLVKINTGGNWADTEPEISVKDDRIERGLWELEYRIMQSAGLQSMNGLDFVMELLRKGRLSLPHHNDLRSEVLMNRYTLCIGSLVEMLRNGKLSLPQHDVLREALKDEHTFCIGMGKDKNGCDDLYGVLLFNDEIVLRTEPQTRMGYILDNMEKAVKTLEEN